MSRYLAVFLVGLSITVMDDGSKSVYAQAYPRVMSPTGRFYGPTQAHYQYERQYGRPWYGGPAQFNPNTGVNIQVGGWGGFPRHGGFYAGAVPFAGYGYPQPGFVPFGGYGYGVPAYGVYQNQYGVSQYGFGSIQQYQQIGPQGPQGMLPLFGPAPTFSWQQPDFLQQPLVPQPQPGGPFGGQPANPGPAGPAAVPPEPMMARPHNFLPVPPSTVAQRQRSLHLQGQGDIWFRQQNFLQAYSRYKQAAAAAPDLGAPRFRMAYALMALHRYELAVPEMQRGIRLDPTYPLTGDSPGKIYGEENRIATAALPQTVAAWVRQDIRSSDRLFLLGALLMINGDHVRARVLLETAAQFGAEGPTDHIAAFLKLENGINPGGANGGPGQLPAGNADDRPPVPEVVEEMLRNNNNWLPPIVPPGKPNADERKADEVDGPQFQPRRPQPQVQPQAAPQNNPQPIPKPVVPAVPAATPMPVAPPQAATSGYQPIPKKGENPQPQPAEQTAPSDVQPAGQQAPDSDSGPVIPIPGSGK